LTRTLYLHLGPAKTGTSALQRILSCHDDSVVLYPRVGLWGDGSHHNLVLNFFGGHRRPEMVREDPDRLLGQIGELARQSDRNVVISSEILAGRKDLRKFASALQSAIGGEPLRLMAVIVVREHLERAASLYNQRVKDAVFGEQRHPDEFLVGHAEQLCHANLLRRLKRAGFGLTVINYHPAETLVPRCLARLGFPAGKIPEIPRRNVSLGRKALIATLAANRAVQSREERASFDASIARIPGRFAPSQVFFSEEAISKVRRIVAADRRFLREQFDVRLPRPGQPGERNAFVISEREFSELSAMIRGTADIGGRIAEALRGFVDGNQEPAQMNEAGTCTGNERPSTD
jgi:hypothetical protein